MSYYDKNSFFGASMDDIARAAREFGEKMRDLGAEMGPAFWDFGCHDRGFGPGRGTCGSAGYQGSAPWYFYPPVNSYVAKEGSLVIEFALAGMDQDSVSISFQGDYLVLSAKAAAAGAETEGEEPRYCRHSFRPRDIIKQKYRVPADDYNQELAKASFKNGVLTVVVPPKENEGDAIKIEIIKEGN
jgi:Molecular chaperone (small heat shock protein)